MTQSIMFDPAIANAGAGQLQASSGAGNFLTLRSQPAATSSAAAGGDMSFILGKDDATGTPRIFWFGLETQVGGAPPSTNYINVAMLKWLPGAVANLVLGGGTNAVGAGVAGVEISSFTSMSIATENSSPINLVIAGINPTQVSVNRVSTDGANEIALGVTYTGSHATSGDVSGLQLSNGSTSIGSGQLRYLDIVDSGTRQFDIRPNSGFSGVNLVANGYLFATSNDILLEAATQVNVISASMKVANSGVWGWILDSSTADVGLRGLAAVGSMTIAFEDNTTASATGATLALHGQNATGASSTGGDLELSPGTGTSANGALSILNVPSAASASAGSGGALPSQPAEYLTIKYLGNTRKIPLYNP